MVLPPATNPAVKAKIPAQLIHAVRVILLTKHLLDFRASAFKHNEPNAAMSNAMRSMNRTVNISLGATTQSQTIDAQKYSAHLACE
jgi:hypothetical protein